MSGILNRGLNVQQYVYDFSVDGGTAGAISLSSKAGYSPLPQNSLVLEVDFRVVTAVVGTSSTLAWGNTTDADGYSGTAIAEATLIADYVNNGASNGAALLWDDTNDHSIPFLVNSANDADFKVTIGVANLTAGKVVFFVRYLLGSVNS